MPGVGIYVPMTLLEHLKLRGRKLADFAADVGEPESTIRKIVYGQRQPSLPLAVKLAAATNGDTAEREMVISPEKEAA